MSHTLAFLIIIKIEIILISITKPNRDIYCMSISLYNYARYTVEWSALVWRFWNFRNQIWSKIKYFAYLILYFFKFPESRLKFLFSSEIFSKNIFEYKRILVLTKIKFLFFTCKNVKILFMFFDIKNFEYRSTLLYRHRWILI